MLYQRTAGVQCVHPVPTRATARRQNVTATRSVYQRERENNASAGDGGSKVGPRPGRGLDSTTDLRPLRSQAQPNNRGGGSGGQYPPPRHYRETTNQRMEAPTSADAFTPQAARQGRQKKIIRPTETARQSLPPRRLGVRALRPPPHSAAASQRSCAGREGRWGATRESRAAPTHQGPQSNDARQSAGRGWGGTRACAATTTAPLWPAGLPPHTPAPSWWQCRRERHAVPGALQPAARRGRESEATAGVQRGGGSWWGRWRPEGPGGA